MSDDERWSAEERRRRAAERRRRMTGPPGATDAAKKGKKVTFQNLENADDFFGDGADVDGDESIIPLDDPADPEPPRSVQPRTQPPQPRRKRADRTTPPTDRGQRQHALPDGSAAPPPEPSVAIPRSALAQIVGRLKALESEVVRLRSATGTNPRVQRPPPAAASGPLLVPAAQAEERLLLAADWGKEKHRPAETGSNRNRIDFFLRMMMDRGASDLHLHVGNSPIFRQSGTMQPMRYRPLRQPDWERLMQPICPEVVWKEFKRSGDGDFAYEIEGLARFRVNLLRQHRGSGSVFRVIPSNIMTLEQLGIPPQVARFAEINSGLVLVTGPTGSGKSTTLAAIIDLINRRKPFHIITVEDPIEFVHPPRRSLVHQREIGVHARTFPEALSAAVREDPDLILVGEMRDRITMTLALEAAEKGMLVFGTLHTNSASKTVDRVINAFPSAEQDQIRTILASSLRGVVSQQLCKKVGGGRVAAVEILFSSRAMSNLIREGKTHHIPSLMQTGTQDGMMLMDASLTALLESGTITREDALEKAVEKKLFKEER
jgi:twitching motility protein PilT